MSWGLQGALLARQYQPLLAEAARRFRTPGRQAADALVAARAAAESGCWAGAVRWADRGLRLDPRDAALAGSLHFECGRALIRIGDLSRAERHMQAALCLGARERELHKARPEMLLSMASLLRLLGRGAEELGCLQEAAQGLAAQGRLTALMECRRAIAWRLLLDRRPGEAWPHLQAVQVALKDHGYPELAADAAIAEALYQSLMGRVERTRSICLALSGQPLLLRQRAEIAWLCGRCALAAGNLDAAHSFVGHAMGLAVQEWDPPLLERVSTLQEELRSACRGERQGAPAAAGRPSSRR